MTLPHWENYWQTGPLVSCPTDDLGGHTGKSRAVWEEFFRSLADGARLLDVGTGNGALPLIALEIARQRQVKFEVHGIDLARIDPCRDVPDGVRLFKGATFHGGVAVETMSFPSASIDAVSGLYSLEYTDHEAALRELRRVMAVGAPARFVLHHASSIVVSNARESLRHGSELEERATAFADLRDFVAAEHADAARASQLYDRMIEQMQRLHRLAMESKGSNLLTTWLAVLGSLFERRQQLALADFISAIDKAHWSFKAEVQRLRELVAAALDEDSVRRLVDQASAGGFHNLSFVPLWEDEETLIGWQLDMKAGPTSD